MELDSDDGATIPIKSGSAVELGRGLQLGTGQAPYVSDRTVSRRHMSIHLCGPDGHNNDPDAETSVSFQVIGKNPIWVLSRSGGDKRVYGRSEKGELRAGDSFTLSIKNPFFFKIRRKDGREDGVQKVVSAAVQKREKRAAETSKGDEKEKGEALAREKDEKAAVIDLESELESLDVSKIDPVKEFGFVVKGHEFDHYPRQRIRPAKNWRWFLEEPRENSDEAELIDEESRKGKKGGKRSKKKGRGNDDDGGGDDEWTGESEDEKIMTTRVGSVKRPKYSTRSTDPKKPWKGSSSGGKCSRMDDFEEEDETLGGFIVTDEEEEEEAEEEEEEEEEEDKDYEDDG